MEGSGSHAAAGGHVGAAALLAAAALMCVAMMLPLALPAARHVGVNTFRPRRLRALAVFGTAFLLPFVALGLLLPLAAVLVDRAGGPGADSGLVVGIGLLVAAAWQATTWKRWAVLSCSETVPLPPAGLAADRACAEFGIRQGLRCLAACWPLMALMGVVMVVPTGVPQTVVLAGMALVTAMTVAESRSRRRRQLIPLLAAPLAVAGALAWVALA